MISRRQHLRSGTRMNIRGIDDDGNVANFVETEQIIKIGKLIFSFVITRGSVPIFWSQGSAGAGIKTLYEDLNITRPLDMTRIPFRKHFKS